MTHFISQESDNRPQAWVLVVAPSCLVSLAMAHFNNEHQYMNTITKGDSLKSLKDAIQSGIEAWETAGREVVRLLDIERMTLDEIASEADSEYITENVLAQFERIGRQQVLPKLLVMSFPASKYLQRMPMSEQTRLIDGCVELLVIRDNGTDTLSVQSRDLTQDQCKQVFCRDGVRSLGAQRAFIEDRRKKIPCSASLPTWKIKNGKVIFGGACELTRQELAVILAQMP